MDNLGKDNLRKRRKEASKASRVAKGDQGWPRVARGRR